MSVTVAEDLAMYTLWDVSTKKLDESALTDADATAANEKLKAEGSQLRWIKNGPAEGQLALMPPAGVVDEPDVVQVADSYLHAVIDRRRDETISREDGVLLLAAFAMDGYGHVVVERDDCRLRIHVDGQQLLCVDLETQALHREEELLEVYPSALIYGAMHQQGDEPLGHVEWRSEGVRVCVDSGRSLQAKSAGYNGNGMRVIQEAL